MLNKKILLSHGSGGKLTHQLIKNLFLKEFDNSLLQELKDSAIFSLKNRRIAFTTDSYVVNPIFFPGSDIGKLAVCGTVNDLAVVGAKPLYISSSFIIEEGFPFSSLKKIVKSMKKAAEEAEVKIVTGDTKVVEVGGADKIFINTSGVGIIEKALSYNVKPKDLIILNGYIGDHGIAVISCREGLKFKAQIISDCAPLNKMVTEIMGVSKKIKWLRDPTRGGIATTLNELAQEFNLGVEIWEEKIPIRDKVKGACEMLGFDPLYVANEGKMVIVVDRQDSEIVLKTLQKNKYGKQAAIIGEITEETKGKVYIRTQIGGTRIVDMLVGEQLPRIC